jgi:hypothetical protein
MNEELIKEVAELAGFDVFCDSIYVKDDEGIHRCNPELHRYTELIVQECISIAEDGLAPAVVEVIKQKFGVK